MHCIYTDKNFVSIKNKHGRPIMALKIWNFITTISKVILILNVSTCNPMFIKFIFNKEENH